HFYGARYSGDEQHHHGFGKAVSCMLKNVSNHRLQSIQDVTARGDERLWTAKLTEIVMQLEASSRKLFPRIAIKTKGRILFVSPVDLLAVEAKGNYVLLQGQS